MFAFLLRLIDIILISNVFAGTITEISNNHNFSIVFNEGGERISNDENKLASSATISPISHNDATTKSPLGQNIVFHGR